MIRLILISMAVWLGLACNASAAQVCPATQDAVPPTDWTAPGCIDQHIYELRPDGQMVWVRTSVEVADAIAAQPLALRLSGRFSARLWINGQAVGRNGLPGLDRASEAPGLMDVEISLPSGVVRAGDNEIVLLVSDQHAWIDLAHPFHGLSILPLGGGPDIYYLVRRVMPVMMALGILLAGLIYFSGLATVGQRVSAGRVDTLLLASLCALAAGQLIAETLRAIWAYPYPVQDLRLLAIAAFSAGFGVLACAYVARRLWPGRVWWILGVAIALSASTLYGASGFDQKSSLAMFGPLFVALCASLLAIWRARDPLRRRRAAVYSAALAIFVGASFLRPTLFLDALFFYLVAGLLAVLLIDQVLERAREQAERQAETARADQLQLVLDRLEPDQTAPPLVLRSAGRVEHIPLADIAHVQGADGYAEIVLVSGRKILHTQSLNALEAELPAAFLKVHRSHIVNTDHVRALDRDSAGTGRLLLSTGETVPVSRRTLPRVRQALV